VDKGIRNTIERATQRARKLLEEDFALQLEGTFDVLRAGTVAPKAGPHLTPRQIFQRDKIVAAIEHKQSAGMSAADAVADYLRDAAFTALNRFVALKMLEARDLLQECITKGEQSAGYREFCGLAPGVALLPDSAGYRLYIESLFDELSTEVKVLFDRRDVASVLWPKRAVFAALLDVLNATDLVSVWGEDETIGWVYQYFNGGDERRAMREASQAPRNSHELAVRNQFFTPRYVVQFLTDNTLGRIWYEMRGTETVLAERCEYMVQKTGEEVVSRPKKDPRDLRVLDPACGSGHFLLYAFDLLLTIYEEAYSDPTIPKSEATGKTLAADYPRLDALRKAVPGLVLAHNLHGVDIDPRCVQIAQLALWMRAQRAYRDFGVGRGERSQIRRSNIVVAEPLVPGDHFADFIARLGDIELERMFTNLIDMLKLAGDLGLLLRVETLVARQPRRGQTGDLFAPPEARIRAALARFGSEEGGRASTRRRLFSEDAAQGLGLLETAEKKFDVVLMNPPFGDPTPRTKEYLANNYRAQSNELYACFVERAVLDLCNGLCGQLTPREFLTYSSLSGLRKDVLTKKARTLLVADFGLGVMDAAMVRAAAYVVDCRPGQNHREALAFRLIEAKDKSLPLLASIKLLRSGRNDACTFVFDPAQYSEVGEGALAYWIGAETIERFHRGPFFEEVAGDARLGVQTSNNEQFVRLRWEVMVSGREQRWRPYMKGGEFAKYASLLHLVIDWRRDGTHIQDSYGSPVRLRESWQYERAGLNYPLVNEIGMNVSVMPVGTVFDNTSPSVYSLPGVDTYCLLGLLNSRFVEFCFRCLTSTRHWQVGYLRRLPWCVLNADTELGIARATARAIDLQRRLLARDEVSPEFRGLHCLEGETSTNELSDLLRRDANHVLQLQVELLEADWELDCLAFNAFQAAPQERDAVRRIVGVHPCESEEAIRGPMGSHADVGDDAADGGHRQHRVSLFAIEDEARKLGCSPRQLLRDKEVLSKLADIEKAALSLISYWFGVGIGRWDRNAIERAQPTADPFAATDYVFPGAEAKGILVDDSGHQDDVVSSVLGSASLDGFADLSSLESELVRLGTLAGGLRDWLASEFFPLHIKTYSKSRRKAPIYWQLATSSASYSVWLYIHSFSRDTLFRIQNDYAGPKLAHEERQLETMRRELRESTTAADRNTLAARELLVEELRAFLEELNRVAPLWNPNLDDGVIINFAPLWRLVPHHKPWQRELQSTWDALCAEEYDWAHLAMHLWPERVVPKCATNRSIAIAHGLESEFWVEGADRKWKARPTPLKPLEELVRERSSPAVKAALKSLLDAPTASGTGRARGRRTASSSVIEEGSR
jgi:hypothetical protein